MIFRCSFPSNSLFLWIIRRWDSRTNLAFDFLSNFFDLLPQTKDGEWLNCCPKCFVFNHDLPELSSTGTASPLNNCSFVLSGERMRSTNLACWPFEKTRELLPQLKDEEWLNISNQIITYLNFYILLQFPLLFTAPLFICRNVARMVNKS